MTEETRPVICGDCYTTFLVGGEHEEEGAIECSMGSCKRAQICSECAETHIASHEG